MVKKFDWQYFGPETTKNIVMDDDLTTEERQENKKEAKEINAQVKMATIEFKKKYVTRQILKLFLLMAQEVEVGK